MRAVQPHHAGFVRVHRSAIVRTAAVVDRKRPEAGDFAIRLRSGALVTMSRSHRDPFEAAMTRVIR